MAVTKTLVFGILAPVLLLAGVAIGMLVGNLRNDGLWVTEAFVADRMAQCHMVVRVHEIAEARGDSELRELVAGEIGQCNRVVDAYPHLIGERDFDTAQRIIAAVDRPTPD